MILGAFFILVFPIILVFRFRDLVDEWRSLRAVATQRTRTVPYLVCLTSEAAIAALTAALAALTVVAAATSL
jgi:hypothetical protein